MCIIVDSGANLKAFLRMDDAGEAKTAHRRVLLNVVLGTKLSDQVKADLVA